MADVQKWKTVFDLSFDFKVKKEILKILSPKDPSTG